MLIFFVILYFAVLIFIGVWTRKASASPMDYYVAGRKVGPFVNGAALMAVFLSPASFLGLPAFVFILGYPFWWAATGVIAGMPIATLLTALPLRRYAPVSFTDYYADRYEDQKGMRWLIGAPTVIAGVLYIVLSLIGLGLFLMAIIGIPYWIAVIIGAAVVLFYIYFGGMIATTWSAAFQGVIITISAFIAAIVILSAVGGFSGWSEKVLEVTPHFFTMPYADPQGSVSHPLMGMWSSVVLFWFVWYFGYSSMPYTVVRFITAMDEKSARRAVFWSTLMGSVLYFALYVASSVGRYLMQTMHPISLQEGFASAEELMVFITQKFGVGVAVTDYSYIAIVESLQIPWVLAIICAGGLSIAMATASGWVMVLNTLIGRDIMGKALENRWAINNPVASLRLWSIIVVVVSAVIAIDPVALIADLSGWAFMLIVSTVCWPLVLGIWWERSTKAATYVSVIVFLPLTLISWLYAHLTLGSAHLFFLNPSWVTPHQIYWIFVSLIVFIIVSLLTKPASKETIENYSTKLTK